ncbi:MAG: hypothetical protein JO023_03285 [Chloroflexi bacterium]|nr:hypothetical protein [Chloroflexota bacterium]
MDFLVSSFGALLSAWALVFLMNAVTFPLPPAWMVLAAYHATTPVPLLPLTIGGSAAAALGRMVFARLVGTFTLHLPADARANAQALAAAAHTRWHWPWLFVLAYSFLPISSDGLFVAVGMGMLPAHSSLLAFFLARSVFNTVMVQIAGPVVSNVADLFAGRFGWSSLLVVVAAVAAYVLFVKLPWARWLGVQQQVSS